jgi:hypothetical protein
VSDGDKELLDGPFKVRQRGGARIGESVELRDAPALGSDVGEPLLRAGERRLECRRSIRSALSAWLDEHFDDVGDQPTTNDRKHTEPDINPDLTKARTALACDIFC